MVYSERKIPVPYDGIDINYRGRNREEANQNLGLRSGDSGEMEIKEKIRFQDLVQSPVGDPSCKNAVISSWYGYRKFNGRKSFHHAIDIAGPRTCKIVAVYQGSARTEWYAGNTVSITHNPVIETKYGHTEKYIGIYPRNVNSGEYIMYMGCSGICNGVHVHFMVLENGKSVDPWKYFGQYFKDMNRLKGLKKHQN